MTVEKKLVKLATAVRVKVFHSPWGNHATGPDMACLKLT